MQASALVVGLLPCPSVRATVLATLCATTLNALAYGVGVVCLQRLKPEVARLSKMEQGKAAAPIQAAKRGPGAITLRRAEWLYAAPVAVAAAWAAVQCAQGAAAMIAIWAPSLRPDTQESIAAGLAVIVTAACLLVLHVQGDSAGGVAYSITTLALLAAMAVAGNAEAWMTRAMCGALALMLGVRLVALFVEDE
mgnify:CR=1 FL=1